MKKYFIIILSISMFLIIINVSNAQTWYNQTDRFNINSITGHCSAFGSGNECWITVNQTRITILDSSDYSISDVNRNTIISMTSIPNYNIITGGNAPVALGRNATSFISVDKNSKFSNEFLVTGINQSNSGFNLTSFTQLAGDITTDNGTNKWYYNPNTNKIYNYQYGVQVSSFILPTFSVLGRNVTKVKTNDSNTFWGMVNQDSGVYIYQMNHTAIIETINVTNITGLVSATNVGGEDFAVFNSTDIYVNSIRPSSGGSIMYHISINQPGNGPRITNTYTSPIHPLPDLFFNITAEITSELNNGVIYANFSIWQPNGTIILNNVNGSFSKNGQIFNYTSNNFLINLNGTWSWNVTTRDNTTFREVFTQGFFIINGPILGTGSSDTGSSGGSGGGGGGGIILTNAPLIASLQEGNKTCFFSSDLLLNSIFGGCKIYRPEPYICTTERNICLDKYYNEMKNNFNLETTFNLFKALLDYILISSPQSFVYSSSEAFNYTK